MARSYSLNLVAFTVMHFLTCVDKKLLIQVSIHIQQSFFHVLASSSLAPISSFYDTADFLFFFLFFFFNFAHTNDYNTLHLQFITGNCYHLQKRNKKKKKGKVHKNTIVYILPIKRRLSALWSSITHLPVCHLHFN